MILAASGGQDVKVTNGCHMPRPAQIKVKAEEKKLRVDTSRTLDELQGQKLDTVSPYGFDTETHTNGFTTGALGMQSEVKLDYSVDRNTGGFCLWYDTINIIIEVDPEIVIGKEVAADRCMYKAVYDHEMKHVNVERKIANKYAHAIGNKIYKDLEGRGFMVGPVEQEKGQDVAERMKTTVRQLLEFQMDKLNIERKEAQQAVDTLAEYERVKKQCPNFNPNRSSRRR